MFSQKTMKRNILIISLALLLVGCKGKIILSDHYNRTFKDGKFIDYERKELKHVNFLVFNGRTFGEDVEQILREVNEFREKHKEIGRAKFAIGKELTEKLSKKQIEDFAKNIGAEYVLAYELDETDDVTDRKTSASVGHNPATAYYLVFFFADKK